MLFNRRLFMWFKIVSPQASVLTYKKGNLLPVIVWSLFNIKGAC